MASKHVRNPRPRDHRTITIEMLHHRRRNLRNRKLPKTKANLHHPMIHVVVKRNHRVVRRKHIVRNIIRRNHHRNELIQHEVDQDPDRDHVVIDRATGSYRFRIFFARM